MISERNLFVKMARKNYKKSFGQNLQDLWGIWENLTDNNEEKYFVEFGALTGINVSNSYLMERLGWDGIIAEPHPDCKKHLEINRNCNMSFDAVHSVSGESLNFKIIKGKPARSTLAQFERPDQLNEEFKYSNHIVRTISLFDLLEKFSAPKTISFLSVDTEGSEYEILSAFKWDAYKFNSICVEYGDDVNRKNIFDLLSSHNYLRKWPELSDHDDWYIHAENKIDSSKLNESLSMLTLKLNDIEDSTQERRMNRLERKLNTISEL